MKKKTSISIVIIVYILFFFRLIYAQSNLFILSGIIKSKYSKEHIISAKITILTTSIGTIGTIGTITNKEGYYSLQVPKDSCLIEVFAFGYKPQYLSITVNSNRIIDIELDELMYEKNATIVIANLPDENVKSTSISKTTISIQQIKSFPMALSEPDVVRFLLNTPGISTASDLASGFNVRGGSTDQNLVLLDDMTLFNPYHFSGIFSSINSDVVKSASLYKSILPIEYGGRTSSLLDITQKNGNANEYSASVFLSLTSAKALLEGPLGSDKGSFLIAARRSYFDLYLNTLHNLFPTFVTFTNTVQNLFFYDINARLTYSFDIQNEIHFSFYTGNDVVNFPVGKLGSFIDQQYGNIASSFAWKHKFSEGVYSNLVCSYTNYFMKNNDTWVDTLKSITKNKIDTTRRETKYSQYIHNIELKYNLSYIISNTFVLKMGVQGLFFILNPGTTTESIKPINGAFTTQSTQGQNRYFTEWAIYIGAEHSIINQLKIDYGIRSYGYFGLGPLSVNEYINQTPIRYTDENLGLPTIGAITSITKYSDFQLSSYYFGIEPRLSGRLLITEETSIKFGYSWLHQSIQTISTTDFGLPKDMWFISDKYIKPQQSHNFSLGIFQNFLDNEIEISIEGYFRLLQNANDYVENAQRYTNINPEQIVSQTDGRSFGLEVYLVKNKGNKGLWTDNFMGTISYTFSKTERKIPNEILSSLPFQISEYYTLGYDKTHNFNISLSYVYEDWTFAASLTYQTNIPYTLPINSYITSNIYYQSDISNIKTSLFNTSSYGYQRNNYRLSDYHRLDISIRKDFSVYVKELQQTLQIGLSLSIYNVYSHVNPFMLFYAGGQFVEKGLIPIAPSLGVEFKL